MISLRSLKVPRYRATHLKVPRYRARNLIAITLGITLLYILYLLAAYRQLLRFYEPQPINLPFIRGIHITDKYKYSPDVNGMFTCLKSYQLIEFKYVNDDYCDCDDNTDEPGTNACPNGVFYCTSSSTAFANPIPSSRVNDGICDCCDGSDEYNSEPIFPKRKGDKNERITRHVNFCPNTCNT